MKKNIVLSFVVVLIVIFHVTLFRYDVKADGYFYVTDNYISLSPGESTTVNVGADYAAGKYEVATGGNVSAQLLEDGWLDCNSQAVRIYAEGTGLGYVYITVVDGTSYDKEDLSGWNATITVEVGEPNAGFDGRTDHEPETEPETEPERFETEIGGLTYIVVDNNEDTDLWEGYEVEETEVEGHNVTVMVFHDKKGGQAGDVTVFMLADKVSGETDYYLYDEVKKEFTPLPYIKFDDRVFVALDLPEDFKKGTGYDECEVEIKGVKVKALRMAETGENEAYYIDEKAKNEIYYVYFLSGGNKYFYSYDSERGTLQRIAGFEKEPEVIEKEPETLPEAPEEEPEKNTNKSNIIFLILFIVAIAALAAMLAIFLKAGGFKNNELAPKKNIKENKIKEAKIKEEPEASEEHAEEETPVEEEQPQEEGKLEAEPAMKITEEPEEDGSYYEPADKAFEGEDLEPDYSDLIELEDIGEK